MNPLLIYPPDTARAKRIQQHAESEGAKIVHFPKENLENYEDFLFGMQMANNRTHKKVSREEVMKILSEK
jgi:hypothetical protein